MTSLDSEGLEPTRKLSSSTEWTERSGEVQFCVLHMMTQSFPLGVHGDLVLARRLEKQGQV